jgi:hypothetical protein
MILQGEHDPQPKRRALFSAVDHVRYCGLDFAARLAEVGFTVTTFRMPPDEEECYGLLRDEWPYVATKPPQSILSRCAGEVAEQSDAGEGAANARHPFRPRRRRAWWQAAGRSRHPHLALRTVLSRTVLSRTVLSRTVLSRTAGTAGKVTTILALKPGAPGNVVLSLSAFAQAPPSCGCCVATTSRLSRRMQGSRN